MALVYCYKKALKPPRVKKNWKQGLENLPKAISEFYIYVQLYLNNGLEQKPEIHAHT